MGYLDDFGYAIAAALDAASIRWCIVSGDGIVQYEIRQVDENGVSSRRLMSPGEVAALLDVEYPPAFP